MNFRFLRRASGRAVVVGAMTFGFIGTAASVASASGGNNFYVATTGTNAGNNCSASTNPCQTISYALQKQAAENVSGTIHVAAGTYVEQVTATTGNDNVTIKGAGEGNTIIEPPSSGLASDTDTDSSQPQFYVVDVQPGTTGFNIDKLTVNGLNASSFLDSDGDGCAQDFVGIYYHASSGLLKKVQVTGADLPADLFGCQGGQGIYVNSTPSDAADVTMSKVSLTAPTSTTVTKADLPASTYNNDILPVKSVPGTFTGGPVIVNGYNMTATPDGPKDLLITGTTSTDSPSGSAVNYDPYTSAYDKNGITCDDNETTCSITGSVIQGDGPTNSVGQNGIQAFGAASVTIGGSSASLANTVSGDTYTGGGGSGNAASGILLLNNGPTSVEGNTVSDSDVDIYAGEVQAYGLVYPTPGKWAIANNTVSGATSEGASAGENGYGEGIQLDSTTNNVVVTNNEVTASAQANILLTGVSGATIGGLGSDVGNIVSDSFLGAGIVVGGPGTECEVAYGSSCAPGSGNPDQFSSTGNAIEENSSNSNGAGLILEGAYDPSVVGPSDPDAAYSNTIGGNVWENNAIVNVADFSAFGSTTPSNSFGSSLAGGHDTCEPVEGGSASLDQYTGVNPVPGVTLTAGSPTATVASGGFPNVTGGMGVLDVTTPTSVQAGTTVSTVSGNTLTLSANAVANSAAGGDTLYFGNYWAC
jgi:hypothetical protein